MSTKRPPHEEPLETYYSVVGIPDRGFYCLPWAELAPGLDRINQTRPSVTGPVLIVHSVLIVHPAARLMKPYEPLKDRPTLYLDFAALPPEQDAVLGFANQFGWLGIKEAFLMPPRPPADLPNLLPGIVVPGERLERWCQEIQTLKLVLHIWELVQKKKVERLKKFIRWEPATQRVLFEGGVARSRILAADHRITKSRIHAGEPAADEPLCLIYETIAGREQRQSYLYSQWKAGEVLGPALLFVAEQINSRLRAHVSPLVMIEKNGTPAGHVVPKNLLGGLWLQLYQAVTGQLHIRKCVICKRDMNVSENRSTKRMHESCAHREQMRRYFAKKKKEKKSVKETR